MIDRSHCAYPVIRQALEPCGAVADVQSQDQTRPWAYCQTHARKALEQLHAEVRVDMSEGRPAAVKRQMIDALELGLERA